MTALCGTWAGDAMREQWQLDDFPQEIHYLLAGDRLTAIVSGPDRETGWEFSRAAPCTPDP